MRKSVMRKIELRVKRCELRGEGFFCSPFATRYLPLAIRCRFLFAIRRRY